MLKEKSDLITSWCHCSNIHLSWRSILHSALQQLDREYLHYLLTNKTWLPGKEKCLNAFSVPFPKIKYILMGESPYPRSASANGYAFWDANVGDLWSAIGLSKNVNKATSLRHLMKMLLVAADLVTAPTQTEIAQLDKSGLIKTLDELFNQLLTRGFLLLNASLSLSDNKLSQDIAFWQPFMREVLKALSERAEPPTLLLFGRLAEKLAENAGRCPVLIAEHPYNVSFVTNTKVLDFFRPLQLLYLKST